MTVNPGKADIRNVGPSASTVIEKFFNKWFHRKNLDVPPEPSSEGNLFGGEIVAIGGDPAIDVRHPIAGEAEFPFTPVDTRGPRKNYNVEKDDVVELNSHGERGEIGGDNQLPEAA